MAQFQYDYSPEKFATFPQWMRRQLFEHPRPIHSTDADLSGKTALVTGANQGIGFEISDQLVALNIGKLILGVRDEAKGQAAADKLKARHRDKKTIFEVWKLDMLEYDTITSQHASSSISTLPSSTLAYIELPSNRPVMKKISKPTISPPS